MEHPETVVRVDECNPEADHLRLRREGGMLEIELAYPSRRNMMDAAMTAAFLDLIPRIKADATIRSVLISGEGTAFCSGGDTSWIGSEPDAPVSRLRARMMPFYRTWLAIRELEVPTLAAINGPAVGAGACLALACDVRWAGAAASFSVPFLRLGMHPGMATTFLLPEAAGLSATRDLLLTGRTVGAEEMLRLGLVSRVVNDDELRAEARAAAIAMAGLAPVATALTKAALRTGAHASFEEALAWEALAQPVTMASADLHEGLAAAREKRAPRFTGR